MTEDPLVVQDDGTPDPRKPGTEDTVGAGIGLFVLASFGAITLTMLASQGAGLFVMGLTQLVGVIPLLIYGYVKKRRVLVKVTWIGAGIVFLLNAACFGFVLYQFRNLH